MKKIFRILCLTAAVVAVLSSCRDNKKSGYDELDVWAEQIVAAKRASMGYPVNQNIHLDRFYNWYLANKLENVGLNNVGDPFGKSGGLLGAHKFEREVIEYFAPFYDYEPDNLWGIVTNSGTDGNNHGIYFGVNYLRNLTGKMPIMYVSDEAHYSNPRIADLQNLELRLVKSDPMGRMIPEELEKVLDTTRPCLMVYAMGSTFKGAIDDMDALNAVLDSHPEMQVYRHVDAALFGGYLVFTEHRDMVSAKKYRINSMAISGHKFFGLDDPAGFFLTTREVYDLQNNNSVAYLNGDMKMINCSRSTSSVLKFWWMIHEIGETQWRKQAAAILENTGYFKEQLDKIGYPNWLNEYSNTIFFKRPSDEVCKKYMLAHNYDEQFGGDLSHLVVMQHVDHALIDEFVKDIQR